MAVGVREDEQLDDATRAFEDLRAEVVVLRRAVEALGPALKENRTPDGAVAKFWRLPRVEHAGAICASEPEVADDPERPCREVEAPVEGRFQGPALRSDADPAGGLVVSALSAQLP